jgi:hypothetical protein
MSEFSGKLSRKLFFLVSSRLITKETTSLDEIARLLDVKIEDLKSHAEILSEISELINLVNSGSSSNSSSGSSLPSVN